MADDALARVRAAAVGQDYDEETAAKFLIKERREMKIDFPGGNVHVYFYEPENRTAAALSRATADRTSFSDGMSRSIPAACLSMWIILPHRRSSILMRSSRAMRS